MRGFRVRLDNYIGPLELLVALVERREIDVLDLALSEIFLAYLSELRAAPAHDLEEVGEFLVFASVLLELKSRLLLPAAEGSKRAAEPIPVPTRTQLFQHLEEFRRFQRAADLLAARATRQRALLRRLADDVPAAAVDPSAQSIRELELWDLTAAFSRLLKQNLTAGAERIARDPTPIAVYQDRLETKVRRSGVIALLDLMGTDNTRSQLIGKFLAVLELIKSQRIWAEWDDDAADLLLTAAEAERKDRSIRPAAPVAPSVVDVSAEFVLPSEAAADPWPDLPRVPELPPRTGAWADYEPILPADRTQEKRNAA